MQDDPDSYAATNEAPPAGPTWHPKRRRMRDAGGRQGMHERLQAAAKRERDSGRCRLPAFGGGRILANAGGAPARLRSFQGDVTSRLPLAGCLTPRALAPMRAARKAARKTETTLEAMLGKRKPAPTDDAYPVGC